MLNTKLIQIFLSYSFLRLCFSLKLTCLFNNLKLLDLSSMQFPFVCFRPPIASFGLTKSYQFLFNWGLFVFDFAFLPTCYTSTCPIVFIFFLFLVISGSSWQIGKTIKCNCWLQYEARSSWAFSRQLDLMLMMKVLVMSLCVFF